MADDWVDRITKGDDGEEAAVGGRGAGADNHVSGREHAAPDPEGLRPDLCADHEDVLAPQPRPAVQLLLSFAL